MALSRLWRKDRARPGQRLRALPEVSAGAVKITVPYPPSANRYWRTWRGRQVVSEEARAYKAAVGLLARKAGLKPTDREVTLVLVVYRPRKAGDLSNRIKVLEDALTGHAWGDDAQVVEIHAVRRDDKDNPRVEVQILEAAQ